MMPVVSWGSLCLTFITTQSGRRHGCSPGTGPAWLKGDALGPRRLGGDVLLKFGPPGVAGPIGARDRGLCFAPPGAVGGRDDCERTACCCQG